MIDKKKIFNATNYEKQKIYVAKANSVTEIQFDMDKNYYRFTNTGALPVYVSTSYTPTTQRYDVKVDGNTVSSFNEPTDRDTIYVLNNNNEDITILITSFLDEFDPNFSATGDMAIEVKGTVQTDGIVKSFECEIPNNPTMNKLDLAISENGVISSNLRGLLSTLSKVNNNMSTGAKQDSIIEKLNAIESKIGSGGTGSGGTGSDFSMVKEIINNRDMSKVAWISLDNLKFKKLSVEKTGLSLGVEIMSGGMPLIHTIFIPTGEYENINFYELIKNIVIQDGSDESWIPFNNENWKDGFSTVHINYTNEMLGHEVTNDCIINAITVY